MLTMSKNQVKFGRTRLAIQLSLKHERNQSGDEFFTIRVLSNNSLMSSSEFIALLPSYQFAVKLSSVFLEIPHKAITFQIEVDSTPGSDKPVSIIAKPAPQLKGLWPDQNTFSKWTNGWGTNGYVYSKDHPNEKGRIVFPAATERDFSHFMTFLKNSDSDEHAALWSEISKQVRTLPSGDILIGTNEMPIPWLNIQVIQ